MSIKSGQAVTVDFTTQNPSSGAASDADSLPTGTLVVNGTDNGATVTVTNKATGVYKAAVTLPSLSAGDVVQIRVAATVSSVAGVGIVWQDVADTKLVSDLNDAASAPSAAANATAVRAELTTELGRVDAAVSSRAVAGDEMDFVDAPNATAVAAIVAAMNDLSAADILAMVYEGSETFQDHLRLARAVLLGKSSGGGAIYRDAADSKARVTASLDSSGNRTSVSVDAS